MGFVLGKSGRDGMEYCENVASGKKVAGAIRSLINARYSRLEFVRVLHEGLVLYVLMYGNEREREL